MKMRIDPEKLLQHPLWQQVANHMGFFDARAIIRSTAVQAALPIWKRREILNHVDTSLEIVFPSMGEKARSRCVRAFERSWTNKMAEDVITLNMSGPQRYVELFDAHLTFDGFENLDRALEAGQGVLCVGSHVGSVTLATAALHYAVLRYDAAQRPALRICTEPDVTRFPKAMATLAQAMREFGLDSKFVLTNRPSSAIAKEMREALRVNGLLTTNLDVMGGGRSRLEKSMFGTARVRLPALAGATKLALQTGATVLPWVNSRRPEGFVVRFEPPIEVAKAAPSEEIGPSHEGFAQLSDRLTRTLEGWIVAHKDQWVYWDRFHKRARPLVGREDA